MVKFPELNSEALWYNLLLKTSNTYLILFYLFARICEVYLISIKDFTTVLVYLPEIECGLFCPKNVHIERATQQRYNFAIGINVKKISNY